jgi:hypothetical protein
MARIQVIVTSTGCSNAKNQKIAKPSAFFSASGIQTSASTPAHGGGGKPRAQNACMYAEVSGESVKRASPTVTSAAGIQSAPVRSTIDHRGRPRRAAFQASTSPIAPPVSTAGIETSKAPVPTRPAVQRRGRGPASSSPAHSNASTAATSEAYCFVCPA